MVLKRPAAASVSNLPPREVPIIAVPEKPDWLDEADESAQIQAFLVTVRKSKRETRQEYVNRLRREARAWRVDLFHKEPWAASVLHAREGEQQSSRPNLLHSST